MKKEKSILLGGFYGCGNLGDDAILKALIRAFSEISPHIRVSYLSGGDKALERSLAERGATAVPRRSPAVTRAVRECDALVFGGGSLLQNETGNPSLYAYLSLLNFARLHGKRTAILAGGLGPIDGGIPRAVTASALRRLDYASFRDETACELARLLGAPSPSVSGDLALLLREELCAIPLPPRFLLVSLRKKSGASVRVSACRILHLSEEKKLTPVLCTLFPKEDGAYTAAVAREVSRLYGASGKSTASWMLPRLSAEKLRSVVSRASFVLSGRYHLALFAYSSGVPFSVIGDDPKLLAVKAERRPREEVTRLVREDVERFIRTAF